MDSTYSKGLKIREHPSSKEVDLELISFTTSMKRQLQRNLDKISRGIFLYTSGSPITFKFTDFFPDV